MDIVRKKIRIKLKKFKSLPFSRQILGYYMLLLVITISFCSFLYIYIIKSSVSRMEDSALEKALQTVESSFAATIDRADEYSKIIGFDTSVQKSLGKSEQGNKNLISVDQTVMRLIISSTFVDSVYIFDNFGNMYSAANDSRREKVSNPITAASWYREVLERKGGFIVRMNSGEFFEQNAGGGKYISLIRIINDLDSQKSVGTIILNISYGEIRRACSLAQKENDVIIEILDQDDQIVIYEGEDGFGRELTERYEKGENYFSFEKGSENYKAAFLGDRKTGWKIWGIRKNEPGMGEFKSFGIWTFVILALNAVLLSVGAIIITKFIEVPVQHLLQSMNQVEKKEFSPVPVVEANAELNQLQEGYNCMVTVLNELFQKVLREQKMKRKYELDVLHAQIKPHFLYNTFDSVSALALMDRSEDVFIMMQALGKYYRTSLHKGQEIITIEEEIKIIYNYLIIQKYRYEDVFEVSYEIDELMKKYRVLKLVLQPFVENAIYHGLKTLGTCGHITIRVCNDGEFVLLQVEDDGAGMSEEKVREIMEGTGVGEDKSFGVHGTIERIALFYGRDDLVRIDSEAGAGTIINVRVPKEIEDH